MLVKLDLLLFNSLWEKLYKGTPVKELA